jgi:hypothetical protein
LGGRKIENGKKKTRNACKIACTCISKAKESNKKQKRMTNHTCVLGPGVLVGVKAWLVWSKHIAERLWVVKMITGSCVGMLVTWWVL